MAATGSPVEISRRNCQDDAETARMELIEAAAEGEDALLEKYLDGEELTAEEIVRGLVKVVALGVLRPGVCDCRLGRDRARAACSTHSWT